MALPAASKQETVPGIPHDQLLKQLLITKKIVSSQFIVNFNES